MIETSSRQFPLRHLFWLTAVVAVTLGVWLPSVNELATRHEIVAILIVLARLAIGVVALMVVARRIRLLPPYLRRMPLELQVLVGLTVLMIVLIAGSILLPPLD